MSSPKARLRSADAQRMDREWPFLTFDNFKYSADIAGVVMAISLAEAFGDSGIVKMFTDVVADSLEVPIFFVERERSATVVRPVPCAPGAFSGIFAPEASATDNTQNLERRTSV